jgi:hypothetical protein
MRAALSRSRVSVDRPRSSSSARQRSGLMKGKSLPQTNCPESRPLSSRTTSGGIRFGDQPEMSM